MNKTTELTELLPVKEIHYQGENIQQVHARDLHAFLGVKREFAKWFKERVEKYDFTKGEDYQEVISFCSPKLASKKQSKQGGHNRTDYLLKLSMAKELAVVESNQQGKLARRYFIECEKALKHFAPEAQQILLGEWSDYRESVKSPYLSLCRAIDRHRQRQGKPTPKHLFSNEIKMLTSIVVGMSVNKFKEIHNLQGEVREHLNAQQLAELEYLERADEMLLDSDIADFEARRLKLITMRNNRFKS